MDEEENNTEESFLRRSAFNQYFAISKEMIAYEKDMFAKFVQEGTFVVNNVLKRYSSLIVLIFIK